MPRPPWLDTTRQSVWLWWCRPGSTRWGHGVELLRWSKYGLE